MPIELDNNATTRPSPGVARAVARALEEFWHNPSSVHRGGQAARHAVERARQGCAELIGARPREITFTSGGTESIDLCVRGVLERATGDRRVLVTTRIEHAGVRDLARRVEAEGRFRVRYLPLDARGAVDPARLGECIDERTALVSVQWANNETGAVQPVEEVARHARAAGALFHCDATQWVGKCPARVQRSGAAWLDLMTFSFHKFHGPKGVGVAWVRPGVGLVPRLAGTQELGRRGGTENVPGILGAGVAAEETLDWLREPARARALGELRDEFERRVLEHCPGSVVNASGGERIWNTSNIAFPKLEGEALLMLLSEQGLHASAGAACSSGSLEPSPVLLAMGIAPDRAHGSIRFSLSRESGREEVLEGAEVVARCVSRLAGR